MGVVSNGRLLWVDEARFPGVGEARTDDGAAMGGVEETGAGSDACLACGADVFVCGGGVGRIGSGARAMAGGETDTLGTRTECGTGGSNKVSFG
jgi:hypothetical protein